LDKNPNLSLTTVISLLGHYQHPCLHLHSVQFLWHC